MSVECSPTGEMIRYFLTKLNWGSIFNIFRDLIMGVMYYTNPRNEKLGNRKNEQTKKVRNSKKGDG